MKVVDASALAALIFEEEQAEEVALRLHGAPLIAPTLLRYEITNVCLTKCRRHPADRDDMLRRLERCLRFPIAERRVEPKAVLALALETKLSVYDASYLWLARTFDAELVTLDQALARAWKASVEP